MLLFLQFPGDVTATVDDVTGLTAFTFYNGSTKDIEPLRFIAGAHIHTILVFGRVNLACLHAFVEIMQLKGLSLGSSIT